ncbi:hypothetical protein PENSPDRAFT_735269 [Peniophora sp. CONT]|nr:hypothetical protein PENSPDRAFT_735269 [Peniophora sp. CONT]
MNSGRSGDIDAVTSILCESVSLLKAVSQRLEEEYGPSGPPPPYPGLVPMEDETDEFPVGLFVKEIVMESRTVRYLAHLIGKNPLEDSAALFDEVSASADFWSLTNEQAPGVDKPTVEDLFSALFNTSSLAMTCVHGTLDDISYAAETNAPLDVLPSTLKSAACMSHQARGEYAACIKFLEVLDPHPGRLVDCTPWKIKLDDMDRRREEAKASLLKLATIFPAVGALRELEDILGFFCIDVEQ